METQSDEQINRLNIHCVSIRSPLLITKHRTMNHQSSQFIWFIKLVKLQYFTNLIYKDKIRPKKWEILTIIYGEVGVSSL